MPTDDSQRSGDKVAVVVVTYNRKALLAKCLDTLLSQSRPPDRIYVVDNASTDGTAEMIRNQYGTDVVYDRLSTNSGCSGGLNHGVRRAYEAQFDWIWILDDDAEPASNCLDTLLAVKRDGIGFLAPLVIDALNGEIEVHHHKRFRRHLWLYVDQTWSNTAALDTNHDMIPIEAASFVGPLISAAAIAECGLPDRNFFILWDDTDYTYRISRHRNCYLVPKARVLHHDRAQLQGVSESQLLAGWKTYYYRRNKMWFQRRYASTPSVALLFIRDVLAAIFGVIRVGRGARLRYMRLRLTGTIDGLRSVPIEKWEHL